MTEAMLPATKFTSLQQEWLNLYGNNISEEDLLAIKDLIGKYFFDKLQKKITLAAEQMGYTQDDFDS